MQVDGRLVGGMAFTQLRGQAIEPEVTAGRPPTGPDEVALGAKTLHALGKHLGDDVEIAGRNAAVTYRIVGQVVLPTLLAAQPLADGAAFTGDGYAPLFDQNLFNRTFVGRFAPGSARAAVDRRIDAIPQLSPATGPTVPVEVDRLHGIDWLPATLAVLLGGLAVLAVGHALVTGVRRRRRDLALLKTLGFDRRQLAGHGRVAGDDARARRAAHRHPGRRRAGRADLARRRRRPRRRGPADGPVRRAGSDGGRRADPRQRHRLPAGPCGCQLPAGRRAAIGVDPAGASPEHHDL